jgi:hypothetical protein
VNLTFTIKVPRHPGRRLRVLVRPPAWVAQGIKLGKGYEAAGWFQASKGRVMVGTIALSCPDLNLVAHECCHAAWHLAGGEGADEERVCLLSGELTKKVWARLAKETS